MSHAQIATRQEIENVPIPPSSPSYRPIGHGQLVYAMESSLDKSGLKLGSESYELARGGNQMFGLWSINDGDSELYNFNIGLRNSMDKTLPVGIASGVTVMACSNLIFTGEFVVFRKHTKGLTSELLTELCLRAVENAYDQSTTLTIWLDSLSCVRISEEMIHALTYKAMVNNILPPKSFKSYHNRIESFGTSQYSLFHWHDAITWSMKNNSLPRIHSKNMGLNTLIDNEFPFIRKTLEI
jgi:hypothetical protein